MSPVSDSAPPSVPAGGELAEVERALHSLRLQQQVLATGMSHDLRAPLRAITGYTALLAEHHADGMSDEGRGYLQRIREAAARMDGLIGALLQLSHAGRAQLQSRPVDLSLLAEWSLAELEDAHPGVVIEATVQPGLLAMGDERQLKLVFDQLLDNAVRYSRDGQARIGISGGDEDGLSRVQVRDHGSGFDMRYAARIFEPFQRLHALEDGGGHGMGLAIAHEVVQRHGGRLWVESEPDRGSVFHVELPAVPDAGDGG
ncbi:sensor histidine kinase [Luteimonas dalianensis]|uniref:sensor histidine kinase n=1 Tax=Luteimonas dalianensis TaxID=1148196 RepID=UPI003BF42836